MLIMTSDKSKGKNIVDAFDVVYKTYENLQKLITYLQNYESSGGKYAIVPTSIPDNFLRWKADGKNYYGWAPHSLVLAFQNIDDAELENEWRDGPVYIAEINLYEDDEAVINISRFDYADMSIFPSRLPVSDHWYFYNPLYGDNDSVSINEDKNKFTCTPLSEKKSKRYRGLQKVTGFTIPLVDITSENAYEKVFGGFDQLRDEI